MKKWQAIVDRMLAETIGDGDISHLPGSGKPLKFKDESLIPSELRAAHKLMDDHEVVPDWIVESRRLDELKAELRQEIVGRAARYLREKESAAVGGGARKLQAVEKSWSRYQTDYVERVERYNRDALLYNLKAPQGIQHKQILNGENLIRRAWQPQQ